MSTTDAATLGSMLGRPALAWALAIACSVATVLSQGCMPSAAEESGRFVVAFVDVSGSVEDYGAYRDAWARIVDAVGPGDRVLLARISDETYTSFRPAVDAEMPSFDPWRDNRLRHEREIQEQRQKLREAMEKAIAIEQSPQTDILNAVALAEKAFATDARRPALVFLSDMIEDSPQYDFEQRSSGEGLAHRVADEQSAASRLPDLGGVRIYVAGISAASAAQAREIESFWQAYFGATGGRVVSYAPSLLGFEG